MHSNGKTSKLKSFLYLLLFVTFLGSIFFVLYTNTTKTNLMQSNNTTISQSTNDTLQNENDVANVALANGDDVADAGTGDDVANAASANVHVQGAGEYVAGSVTAKLRIHGWTWHKDAWAFHTGAQDRGTQDIEIGSNWYYGFDGITVTSGGLDDFQIDEVWTCTGGYYVKDITCDAVSGHLQFGVKYDTDDDVTITVTLAKVTYVVSFNANGGQNGMSDQYFYGRDAQNLRANSFTRGAEYGFVGWSTSSSSNNRAYSDGQSINAGSAWGGGATMSNYTSYGYNPADGDYIHWGYNCTVSVTLYAVWSYRIALVNELRDAPYNMASNDPNYVTLNGDNCKSVSYIYLLYSVGYYYDSACTNAMTMTESLVEQYEQQESYMGFNVTYTYSRYAFLWQLSVPNHSGYNNFQGYFDASTSGNLIIPSSAALQDDHRLYRKASGALGSLASGNVEYVVATKFTQPTVLYAHYDANSQKSFTITANLNDAGGSQRAVKDANGNYYIAQNTTITHSTAYSGNYKTAISIESPIRKGYAFSGWSLTNGLGDLGGFSTGATQQTFVIGSTNSTLTANWTPLVYTITLNTNPYDITTPNITNLGTQTFYYKFDTGFYSNQACTTVLNSITKPVRTGYVFNGYYSDKRLGTAPDGIQGNVRHIDENGGFINNLQSRLWPNADGSGYDYDDTQTEATLYASWKPKWEIFIASNDAQDIATYDLGTRGGALNMPYGLYTITASDAGGGYAFSLVLSDQGIKSYTGAWHAAFGSNSPADGYAFSGWFMSQSSGNEPVYQDVNASLPVGTYYARFSVQSYEVTIQWDAPNDGATYTSPSFNNKYGAVTMSIVNGNGTANGDAVWLSGTSFKQSFYYGSQLSLVVTENIVLDGQNNDTGRKYAHFDNWSKDGVVQTAATSLTYGISWLTNANVTYKANLRPVWSLDVLTASIADQTFVGNNVAVSPLQNHITITDDLIGANGSGYVVNNAATNGAITWNVYKENINDQMGWSVKRTGYTESSEILSKVYALITYTGNAYYAPDPIQIWYKIVPRALTNTSTNVGGTNVAFNFALPTATYAYNGLSHNPDLGTAQYNDTQTTYNLRKYVGDASQYHNCEYELSWGTNINAGDATVIVTGHGNFEGSLTLHFNIDPLDINVGELFAEILNDFTYTHQTIDPNTFSVVTGVVQDPFNSNHVVPDSNNQNKDLMVAFHNLLVAPTVLLKPGDFTISLITQATTINGETIAAQDYVNVGSPLFVITAVSGTNFTGSRLLSFNIVPRDISESSFSGVVYPNSVPTGTDGGLTDNEFTLYRDNQGYHSGWVVYRGSQFRPTLNNIVFSYQYAANSIYTMTSADYALIQNTTETPTYGTNLMVGEGTVTVVGIGNYTGTLTLYFEIHKRSLDGVFAFQSNNLMYNGTVQNPVLVPNDNTRDGNIRFTGYNDPLQQNNPNNDYKISYRFNTNIGTNTNGHWTGGKNNWGDFTPGFLYAGSYTITIEPDNYGEESNYEGSQTLTYTIAAREVSNLSVSLSAASAIYNGNTQKPTITVADAGNVLLSYDYVLQANKGSNANTWENIGSGPNDFGLHQEWWRDAGVISIRLVMQATGYAGLNNYDADNVTGFSFTINPYSFAAGDSVTITSANPTYDGLQKTVEFSVYAGGLEISSGDYGISYNNNTNVTRENDAPNGAIMPGATLTITGHATADAVNGSFGGNFRGTLSANFTINPASISGAASFETTGQAVTSKTVTYNGNEQTQPVYPLSPCTSNDMTIVYSWGVDSSSQITDVDFVNAGIITYYVSGVNNYTGSTTLYYQISQAILSSFKYDYTGTTVNSVVINASTDGPNASPVYTGHAYQITTVYVLSEGSDTWVTYTISNTSTSTNLVLQSVGGSQDFSIALSQTGVASGINWTDAYVAPIQMAFTSSSSNYYMNTAIGTFDILPAELSVMQPFLNAIADQVYTGSAIIPDVTFNYAGIVADDYEIIGYDNNVNVTKQNDEVVAGATVTVAATLNRNFNPYGSTIQVTFKIIPQILPADVSDVTINSIVASYVYNGLVQTPDIQSISFVSEQTSVTHTIYKQVQINGNPVTMLNVTIARNNPTAQNPINDYVNVGTFTVTISVNSDNYDGTITTGYVISKKMLTKNHFVVPAYTTYNAQPQKPNITASDLAGMVQALSADDYRIVYYYNNTSFDIDSENPTIVGYITNAGTINIEIRATSAGNYFVDANNDGVYVAADDDGATLDYTYVINRKSLSGSSISFNTMTYNGTTQTISPIVVDDTIVLNNNAYVLTLNTDFSITQLTGELINANGTGTVVIEGIGNFKDSATANFTIQPKNISDETISVVMRSFGYTGQAVTPSGVIKDNARGENGTELRSGIEYNILLGTHEANYWIDKGTKEVQIEGIGNYTGFRYATFLIKEIEVNGTNIMTIHILRDVTQYTFNGEVQKPTVTHISIDMYDENTGDYVDTFIVASSSFGANDIIYGYSGSDNLNSNEMFVYTGNYYIQYHPSNPNIIIAQGYENTYNATYTIVAKEIENDMFTVQYVGTGTTYDGTSHQANVSGVYNGHNMVLGTDFDVTYYRGITQLTQPSDFVNAGTITVNIGSSAARNYSGTLAAQAYVIVPKSVVGLNVAVSGGPWYYTGDTIMPTVTVTDLVILDNGQPSVLVAYNGLNGLVADYRIDYLDAVEVGLATIRITGMNNYDASTTNENATYIINKATLSAATLLSYVSVFNRNPQPAVLASVSSNTVAVPSASDLESFVYYREVAGNWEVTTDITNVGTLIVRLAAKSSSKNFTGYVDMNYQINPAVINVVSLNTTSVVYNATQHYTDIVDAQSVGPNEITNGILRGSITTSNGLVLQQGEYKIVLTRGGVACTDYVNAGSIVVSIVADDDNFADMTTPANATFVINPKDLADESTITVLFYRVDNNGDPVLDGNGDKIYQTSQFYVGEPVAPELHYCYDGTNTEQLVYTVSFTYVYVPSTWGDACMMTFTITGVNGSNYTGTRVRTFQVMPLPWNDINITIILADRVYTGLPITVTAADIVSARDTANNINLSFGTDFEVRAGTFTHAGVTYVNGYYNNVNVGVASVLFVSTDTNYSQNDVCMVQFNILPRDIEDSIAGTLEFEWEFDGLSFAYDREIHQPVLTTATYMYTDGINTYNHNMIDGSDYYLVYKTSGGAVTTPVNAGNYVVVINGTGNYKGTIETTYYINKKSLTLLDLSFTNTGAVYLQNVSQKPQTVLYYATSATTGFNLVEGVDYAITYEYANFIDNNFVSIADLPDNFVNAGSYRVTVNAISGSNYVDSNNDVFVLSRDVLTNVRLSINSTTYNRSAQTPEITIEAQNNAVVNDLSVSYSYKNGDEFISTTTPDFTNAGTIRIAAIADNINYTGSVYADYVINPKQIVLSMIDPLVANFTYDRTSHEASVVIKDNGITLTNLVEYRLVYDNIINAGENTASVTIFGVQNYTAGPDGIVLYYSIAQCDINSLVFDESSIGRLEYNGFVQTLSQDEMQGVLMHGDYSLVINQDFEIIYVNSDIPRKDAGTYDIIIRGTTNYKGSKNTSFVIDRQNIDTNDIVVTLLNGTNYVYNRQDIEPAIKVCDSDIDIDADLNSNNQSNYTVAYQDNRNVEWSGGLAISYAKIIISGNNNYIGTKTVFFRIVPLNIADDAVVKTPATLPVQRYNGGNPVEPQPVLTFNEQTVSVTYSYTDNTVLTENATVTITAAANTNFTGSITMTFVIDTSHISWAVISGIYDVTYNGQIQQLVPTLVYDGHTLVPGDGNDYTVSYIYNRNMRDVGTITVVITGSSGYKGSVEKTYEILPLELQAQDVNVLGVETKTFDGDEQTQENASIFVTDLNLTIPVDYYEIQYLNNVNAGVNTAVMSFVFSQYVNIVENNTVKRVRNNFGGTFNYNFTINKRALNANMFAAIEDQTYAHESIEPDVSIEFNEKSYTPTLGKFSLTYGNNTNVSRNQLGEVIAGATIDVVADDDSNFVGSVQLTFKILPKLALAEYFEYALSDNQFVYNGIEQCPTIVSLTDVLYNETMISGTDYDGELQYLNNINASVTSNAKVVVQFINNYTGNIYLDFVIQKYNLTDNDVAIVPTPLLNYDFDGEEHRQIVVLNFTKGDSSLLELDSNDCVILYSRTDGVDEEQKFIHSGTIYINIVATQEGNFDGSIELSYNINKVNISTVDYALPTNADAFVYNGNQITPNVVLSLGNYVLNSDDIEISYGENINVVYNANGYVISGATINVSTKNDGNFVGDRIIRFAITPRDVRKYATITLSEYQTVYNGQAQLPTTITIHDETLDRDLVLNTEYTLSNTSNIMPNVVVISATGKGNFTGVLTADYEILHRMFSQESNISFNWLDDMSQIVYNRADQKPNFEVRYTGFELNDLMERGVTKDYIVVGYNNNVNATTPSSLATVTIRGVNGYSGEYVATFEINRYDIANILDGKHLSNRKYDGTSHQEAILNQLSSFMVYVNQALNTPEDDNPDYSVDIVRLSGTALSEDLCIDVGEIQLTITGLGNFEGTATLIVNIVSKEIDNLLLYLDDALYYGEAQVVFKGYAYTLSIVARSGADIIEQDGYTIKYFDEAHNEISLNNLDLVNVNDIYIEVEGINNYMGNCTSCVKITPKSLKDDDIEVQNFAEHVTYYYGVEREQDDVVLYLNTDQNEQIALRKGVDYDVVYYNNSYVGRASMVFIGKGNFKTTDHLSFAFEIDKMTANVHPYIINTTYFAGDDMPILYVRNGDTNGVVVWENSTTLVLGPNNYVWRFIPTDSSNYAGLSGVISINALEIVPEALSIDGNYITEYYVYEEFDSNGLLVYLLYNNGRKVLLDVSEYTLNINDGQQLHIDMVPMVRYEDENILFERALGINIKQIPITIAYPNTENLVQTENPIYITPVITNEINAYTPGVITRYYSHKLQAYTDGITQGGEYTISVLLGNNDFVIENGASTNIYVKTGVITYGNGLVTLVDKLGFDDGVYLSFREFDDASQLSKLLDLNTFNVKKFYEVQLWKGNSEYISTHVITIRINVGRDVLEGNELLLYNIPSNADTCTQLEYTKLDKDTAEIQSRILGGFVFGEKAEAPSDAWWIILAASLTGTVVTGAVVLAIILKRRKIQAITKTINLKLGK